MEWSNIRMSKAEFERLQKEYTAAAIKAAEKAKALEKSEEMATVKESTIKPDISAVHSDIAVMTKPKEEISEKTIEPQAETAEETKKSELPVEEETEDIELADTATKNQITATPIEESEEEKVEISQAEYAENLITGEEESSSVEEKNDIVQNDTEICDEHQEQTKLCNNAEETVSDDIADKCDNTAVSGECENQDNQDNHSIDEILRSFESTFMSEEEADKKVEHLSNSNPKPRPAPDFNEAIHNHNNNPGKSGKTCGCEHCRCQNGNRMQEKGGQKPN